MIGIGKSFTGLFVASSVLVIGLAIARREPTYDVKGTFRTENLLVDTNASMATNGTGQVVIGTNTPVATTNLTVDGGYATQTTQAWFDLSDTNHTAGENINIVTRNHETFDTTAGPATAGGLDVACSATKSAGANTLTDQCVLLNATGGDVNVALRVHSGTSVFDDTVNFNDSVHGDAAGTFSFDGTCTLGDSSHNTTIGKNLTVDGSGSSVTAATILGNLLVGAHAASSTLGFLIVSTQNGGDGVVVGFEGAPGPKYWSFYPSSSIGGMSFFEYSGDQGGAGNDRMEMLNGGRVRFNAAGAAPIISGIAPTSVNHGSLDASSSDFAGSITGIGANTSVTLTFSSAFGTTAFCTATPNAAGTPEIIAVTKSASAPVFSCFNTTTGSAANCVDFNYVCVGK